MSKTHEFYEILSYLRKNGKEVSPRGLKCKEIVGYNYVLQPRTRFMNFTQRKLNLDYIKQEFLWYLRGNRKDISIKHVAKMWDGIINPDGSINSNYGYYIFNEDSGISNFDRTALNLTRDADTRRAVICILDNEHLQSETKDYPCTCYINFLIRNNKLVMIVRMRSQDAIYGMGNDAPCFSFVHELMYVNLKCLAPKLFADLELGLYIHSADSFHIYEKHYNMLEDIIEEPHIVEIHDSVPEMTINTFENLTRANKLVGYTTDFSSITDPFALWMLQRDNPATLLGTEEL